MIERILPPSAAAVCVYGDVPDAFLFPEEEAMVRRAVERRRREFASVRWCARRALADLGEPPGPILRGERGAPRWPHGVVGSMTHCEGYRAAAVARAGDVRAIGIDAEPHLPLPEGVLESVARPEEHGALGMTGPGVHADRLLFSAKEAVYKAWFPLTGRWLGFEQASVTFAPDGTFTARLLAPDPPLPVFHGRWAVDGGLIATAVTILPQDGAARG
ncbi:4'-phosphopantetheinyl transferase family protein [Thermomonospora cellulosilytica]|uniref:4'-phosphopantetheinyl transferase EntD n=1 Tax=Thermomonospora cellulosilytica TaxID=1411118 RepID=A0A7W3R9N0_9ACTN|nr:4'-phosphopantetheinyl transferase superfamily protein [Thermomonospora cellulosilytica]MBA9005548.1 4'-phosphopantetheinyl transferase EntD [Thermomonospora cellulosilytica]